MLGAVLPENSHDGYVAAAYIVFFALILIYVAIMAIRVSRIERRLHDLQEGRESETREHELV
jgi:CcmD family protein